MIERQFQFEWDELKAAANVRKHGVSFEIACTVFHDPRLITIADLEHSENEERWFSIGLASNGAILSIAYLWKEVGTNLVEIRLISARNPTEKETRQYQEGA